MASTEAAPTMKSAVRPPVTGWLLKRKRDSAASRFLRQTNRRHFTLDFQSQIFYYGHSDSHTQKTVSLPIPFRDITGVEPFTAEGGEDCSESGSNAPAIQRSNSKSSMGSSIRMPSMPRISFSKRATVEQHGFVLRTSGKSMELVCSSKEEADMWIDAIREAIAGAQSGVKSDRDLSGDETATPELSTAPSSSCATTPRSGSKESASRQATPPEALPRVQAASPREDLEARSVATGSAAPASEKCAQSCRRRAFGLLPPRPPRKAPAPTPLEASSSSVPVSVPAEGSGKSSPSTTTLDVDIREAATPNSEAHAACGSWLAAQPEEPLGEGVAEVISAVEAPKSVASGVVESDATGATPAWGCWGGAAAEESGPSTAQRYSDKGEGLSLQKRLENMEFSDDEDEDSEGPSRSRGCRFQPAETSICPQELAVEPEPKFVASTGSVTVEACESFVAPDSDDE